MTEIFYDRGSLKELKNKAHIQRKKLTIEEYHLFILLRGMKEKPIRKKVVIGSYIADFALPLRNLVIMLANKKIDFTLLQSLGFNVLVISKEQAVNDPMFINKSIREYGCNPCNRGRFNMSVRCSKKLTYWKERE